MSVDQRIVAALEASGIDYDQAGYDPTKSFRDNGIDSLDVMSLLLAIEETFGIKFSEDEANSIRSPAEISALLDKASS